MILTAFRVMLTILATMSLFIFLNIFLTGRSMRREDAFRVYDLKNHRYSVKLLWVTTITSIAIVEGIGRVFHLLHHSPLFWFHLTCLALPFLGLLVVTNVWWNGDKRPDIHRIPARLCIITGVLTNIVGAYLAYQ